MMLTRNGNKSLLELLPALTNKEFRKLFAAIFDGMMRDKWTKEVCLPRQLVAWCFGVECNGRFNQSAALDRFSREVAPLEYSSWEYVWGRCRRLVGIELSPEVWKVLHDDLYSCEERFDFVTGKSAYQCRKDRMKKLEGMKHWMNRESLEVMEYMNTPDPFFATLPRDVAVLKGSDNLEHDRNCFRNFLADPQPLYGPSRNRRTPRIFDVMNGIAGMSKSGRTAILKGCTEIDLHAAHFAILASQWKLLRVQQFLDFESDIWKAFFASIGGYDFEEVKKIIKIMTYCIFYGMGVPYVAYCNNHKLRDMGCKGDFLSHPIIRDIIVARNIALAGIVVAGGATDINGKWLAMSRTVDEKSILAQLSQTVEMKLMHAVIEVAKTTTDFRVVLWLHDGCTVKFHKNKEYWLKKITEAVVEKGKSIGVKIKCKAKDL